MQKIRSLGESPWTYEEIRNSIPEFMALYEQRPMKDNPGGMSSPHMFATWFMLKKLQPKYVIESGVWRGQGTWLIESTVPDAKLFCIELNQNFITYRSENATYFDTDFTSINWDSIENKADCVLFFDDHQNAFDRIKFCRGSGFSHFIFEDNYPKGQGDCYSLKKAFMESGFAPVNPRPENTLHALIKYFKQKPSNKPLKPNSEDSEYLEKVLDVYYEFPPVFKPDITRWNDSWEEQKYPTPEALFSEFVNDALKIFLDDAKAYTWICYAKIPG